LVSWVAGELQEEPCRWPWLEVGARAELSCTCSAIRYTQTHFQRSLVRLIITTYQTFTKESLFRQHSGNCFTELMIYSNQTVLANTPSSRIHAWERHSLATDGLK